MMFSRRALATVLVVPCCALLPVPLAAQVIRGVVVEDGTRTPVPAVELVVRDSVNATVTTGRSGTDGRFRLSMPRAGRYTLTSRHIAYAPVTSEAVTAAAGEEVALEIRLRAEAVALEPVTVVTRRYPHEPRLREFYERAEQNQPVGRGTILMREDIEPLGPITMRQVLGRGPRLAGNCDFFFFLDGAAVASANELETFVSIEDVEGIEIYSNPAHVPARFQQRTAGCYNVMLVWRRPYGVVGRPRGWHRFVVAVAGVLALAFLIR